MGSSTIFGPGAIVRGELRLRILIFSAFLNILYYRSLSDFRYRRGIGPLRREGGLLRTAVVLWTGNYRRLLCGHTSLRPRDFGSLEYLKPADSGLFIPSLNLSWSLGAWLPLPLVPVLPWCAPVLAGVCMLLGIFYSWGDMMVGCMCVC